MHARTRPLLRAVCAALFAFSSIVSGFSIASCGTSDSTDDAADGGCPRAWSRPPRERDSPERRQCASSRRLRSRARTPALRVGATRRERMRPAAVRSPFCFRDLARRMWMQECCPRSRVHRSFFRHFEKDGSESCLSEERASAETAAGESGDRVLPKVGEVDLSGGVPILRRLRARRLRRKIRVTDGARTRDSWSHNPALYLLSYGHRMRPFYSVFARRRQCRRKSAPPVPAIGSERSCSSPTRSRPWAAPSSQSA